MHRKTLSYLLNRVVHTEVLTHNICGSQIVYLRIYCFCLRAGGSSVHHEVGRLGEKAQLTSPLIQCRLKFHEITLPFCSSLLSILLLKLFLSNVA